MKTGKIRSGLLALFMIFHLTACGASTEAYDNAGMNKSADVRTTADAVYYDTVMEAEMSYADDYKNYSYSSSEAPKAAAASVSVSVSGETGAADTSAANDLSERKIIKTANVRYETRTYDDFMTALTACIRQYGAYIESQENYGGSIYDYASTRSAYLTVRVPLESYDAFMQEAGTIGSITYRSETAQDVTMAYVDTESRIKSLRTEYDALLAILEKATKLEDVISLQSRISEVTYQLELHQSQLRKYDDLIAYCTVRIDVAEVEKVTPNVREMTFGEKIRDGLSENFEDIGRDASDFAVWFVTSLPYFVIWGIVIVLLVLLLKRMRVRRKKKKEQKAAEWYLQNTKQNTADETGNETDTNDQTNS